MSQHRPARGKALFLLGLLCALLAAGGWYAFGHHPKTFDAAIRSAFANAAQTHAYAERVQTEDALPTELLQVDGTYLVDSEHERFASYSTTTVTSAGRKPFAFTLDNISIGKDLYTKVQADSAVTLSVPSSATWHHFRDGAVPEAYANIAVAGPVLDNLQIFGNGGSYLSLLQGPADAQLDGIPLKRYTLKLSGAGTALKGGILGTIAERIGQDGIIDLWIDETTSEIYAMRFANGAYVSTTTISDINQPLSILPPPPGN